MDGNKPGAIRVRYEPLLRPAQQIHVTERIILAAGSRCTKYIEVHEVRTRDFAGSVADALGEHVRGDWCPDGDHEQKELASQLLGADRPHSSLDGRA
jgi:hypothetical protein